ncbi:MAG: hypothetical protein ABUR63_06215 [Verrucomicrobiota bacterium]
MKISRKDFLKSALVVGGAGLGLSQGVGCGSSDSSSCTGGGSGSGTGGAGTGGAGTGGAGTGGAGTGGAGTGGAATGGAATGGAATGGRGTGGAATGGAATGGRGTGGAATGGANTGGMGTGGATPFCGPATCANGCCAGTVCVTNLSAQQCGHGGGACALCGGCLRCSTTGTCEVDPMSRWDLTAVSAVINPLFPDGTNWDIGNERLAGPLPDPFAQFEMPVDSPLGATTTLVDTLTPAWNEPIVLGGATLRARDLLPGGQSWLLWLGDEDNGALADVMCEISGPLDQSAFISGGFVRTNLQSCRSVTMKLTCRP